MPFLKNADQHFLFAFEIFFIQISVAIQFSKQKEYKKRTEAKFMQLRYYKVEQTG